MMTFPSENPNHPGPGYWRYETGGELKEAVTRYLNSHPLTRRDMGFLRAYLIQWIEAPVWGKSRHIPELRQAAYRISTRADIEDWTARAFEIGIDPW